MPILRFRSISDRAVGALCLALLGIGLPSVAESQRLIVSDNQPTHRALAELFVDPQRFSLAMQFAPQHPASLSVRQWQENGLTLSLVDADKKARSPSLDDACQRSLPAIAIGPYAASQWVTRPCSGPLVLTALLRHQADPLLNDSHRAAVYLEVDPVLNLRLIRSAMGPQRRVGAFLPPALTPFFRSWKAAAAALDIELIPLAADRHDIAVRQLREKMPRLDALLLLPETHLMDDWLFKTVLVTASRSQIPVFGGLTPAYIEAGVTAAVLPDLSRLNDTVQQTFQALHTGQTDVSTYPTHTYVLYNQFMVRQLGLKPERLNADGG